MKIIMQTNKKALSVQIDKSLNKYDDIVLFPEKLEKANEMLKTVGLPKSKLRNR